MTNAVEVFRIPEWWWNQFGEGNRTPNEVLLKLGFKPLLGSGWMCDEKTAHNVVHTICAYSFGWFEVTS